MYNHKHWKTIYPNIELTFGSQYQPFISKCQLEKLHYVFFDQLVNENSVNRFTNDLIKQVNPPLNDIKYESLSHLSLDNISGNQCVIRPLSYTYYVSFFRSLNTLYTFDRAAERSTTLRQYLTSNGAPLAPDSRFFPSKFGVSGLIVQKVGFQRYKILETIRTDNLVLYPSCRHTSFSGGIEVQDISTESGFLSNLICNAITREAKEELGLILSDEKIEILGIWRDLERLAMQVFAVVIVESLYGLTITHNINEVKSFNFIELDNTKRKISSHKASPELLFMEKLLAIS
ncbi:NUDIX hydrolase [Nitrosomonas ureae]|uniref:Nudix hydrolase domain-containing protein n=1 Tax=Nitrosomonas ureae TaxID=44577 RepID=A0A1H2HGS2_9PROT|nr:NUDIX hydrolase [Nitrosomonas ureae]ALQ51364.1 hypothetical protein ATY38_09140 [Nitrosomonas ureae]SDU30939.1 hypothetical protein SAMN05216406_1492 [Nitrosomonas ureae]